MGNDSDQLALLLQAGKRFQCRIKRFFVQCAKTFVQKQGINLNIVADHMGEAECQCQADDEAFPA